MSDLFHEGVPDTVIDQVFAVMALCPQHTFQILTKRPERMRAYLAHGDAVRRIYHLTCDMALEQSPGVILLAPGVESRFAPAGRLVHLDLWPLPNVWLGVSVEDQVTAETRIPYLLQAPAAKRFISAEPLLGPIDLSDMCDGWKFYNPLTGARWHDADEGYTGYSDLAGQRLDWVIVGGESGQRARPMNPDWARTLRDQCSTANVPFFFKQWGEWLGGEFHLDQVDVLCFKDFAQGRFSQSPGGEREHLWGQKTKSRVMGSIRIGKSAAGRILDGAEHDGLPS